MIRMRFALLGAVATAFAVAMPGASSAQNAAIDKAISDAIARCATVTLTRATYRDAEALSKDVDCYRRAAASAINAMETRSKKLVEVTAGQTSSPSPVPASNPAPVPAPTPSPAAPSRVGWELSPTPEGKPLVSAPFGASNGLQPAWGTGEIPVSADPDPQGAFRMTCAPGALSYVDPIVYPGNWSPHLHQLYGLVGLTQTETYESALAGSRQSTCGSGSLALNRSAYWVPALLSGPAQAIQPDFVTIYYKRIPKTDSRCNWTNNPRGLAAECRNMPQGLRMIAGRDMQNPGTASQSTPGTGFFCMKGNDHSITVDNLDVLFVQPQCQGDTLLYVVFDFPNCWDGKHLDSPNHRDHMAYRREDGYGNAKCSPSHPVLVPDLHVAAQYTLRSGDNRDMIRLSSDMFPNLPRGKSMHGDAMIDWYKEGWETFHNHCIARRLNCSGGDLGDGTQMKMPDFPWENPNRIVPVPPRPAGAQGAHVDH